LVATKKLPSFGGELFWAKLSLIKELKKVFTLEAAPDTFRYHNQDSLPSRLCGRFSRLPFRSCLPLF